MEPELDLLSALEPLRGVLERPHGLLEGPRVEPDGSLVYSDVLAGGVYRVAGDGAPQTVLPKRRGIGGILLHEDGGLVLSGRDVIHVGEAGQRELLAIDGVHGFNDMTTDAAGRVLAGALRFHPLAGERPVPSEVWRIERPGVATIVAEGVDWPNGIAFSPAGTALYVSDTARGVVLVFAADEPSSGEVLAEPPRGAADGLAVDEEGGIWVALGEGGIARFRPDGELDGIAEVPARFVSSLCFGGSDRCDVYITTADSLAQPEGGGVVFHARSGIPGVAIHAAVA